MPQLCTLDEHRVIAASGADRVTLLQGQLTQDLLRLAPGAGLLAGWADARGRLHWAGQLFLHQESCCLLVPATMATSLLARLRMFVLRARVEVAIADLAVVGVMGNADGRPLPPGWQRLGVAGDAERSLLVGPPAGLDAVNANSTSIGTRAWILRDIRAGIPEITTPTAGEFVPQMVNLDLLDGISFSKGCYTGQEIVARTKYLGRIKRRMLRFYCAGEVAAGEPVYGERGPAGQVVRSAQTDAGSEFLAVVHLDALEGSLHADEARNRAVSRLPLPYSPTG